MALCQRLVELGADCNLARGMPEEPRDCPAVSHAIAIAGTHNLLHYLPVHFTIAFDWYNTLTGHTHRCSGYVTICN
jgi:hypothetical protein